MKSIKRFIRLTIATVGIVLAFNLTACANVTTTAENILAGATHAKGTLHVEGYLTDTQGEIEVCKQPEGSTYCEDSED